MPAKGNLSWLRIVCFGLAVGAGIVAGVYGGDLIHENRDAVEVIVVVFPILAGFLVAIMTIVGDPSVFASRSWRAVELARDPTFQSLTRQKYLFLLYLATVAGVFSAALVKKRWPDLSLTIERVYFGLAVTSLLLSMSLPGALMRIQLERHDLLIAAKRGRSNPQPE